jgi:hypothetical protein
LLSSALGGSVRDEELLIGCMWFLRPYSPTMLRFPEDSEWTSESVRSRSAMIESRFKDKL